jgi:hypothetical protein
MADYPKFVPHEICRIFPDLAGEERTAQKRDIALKGVLTPILVKDGYIYDGKNRWGLVEELRAEGHTIGGQLIECPWVELDMNEAEALAYTISLNLQRRQINSSQRAAIAVLANGLSAKYQGLKDMGVDIGDIADKVALEAGTNRTYIFKAASLQRDHPDLLERVRQGEITIPQAEKEVSRRDRGLKVEQGEEQTPEEKAPPDATAVLDRLGQPVPKKLEAVFRTLIDYKQAVELLKPAKEYIEGTIHAGPAAAYLDIRETIQAIKDAETLLRQAQPYTVCQRCKNARGCKSCKDAGWVNKPTYDQQIKEIKQAEKDKEAAEAQKHADAEKTMSQTEGNGHKKEEDKKGGKAKNKKEKASA